MMLFNKEYHSHGVLTNIFSFFAVIYRICQEGFQPYVAGFPRSLSVKPLLFARRIFPESLEPPIKKYKNVEIGYNTT
jgi:hypothetical protein